ncbi:MAG: VOC family protein [Rhodothermales bacterium]|nr:VOC family protein [Rhodothermales bacterium]
MSQRIGLATLVVNEYDAAIEFFVDKLGFRLIEDTLLESENKRWVVVAPVGSTESGLLLARASGDIQVDSIGNQAGGRVAFILYTDDFWRDFLEYKSKGIKFIRDPKKQSYGTVAVFADISGNLWDLLEPTVP